MAVFDKAHRAVHLPGDRRVAFVLQRRYTVWLVVVIALPIAVAWLRVLAFGIHSAFAPVAGITASSPSGMPRGFPVWIRWTHYANVLSIFAHAQRPFHPHGPSAALLE